MANRNFIYIQNTNTLLHLHPLFFPLFLLCFSSTVNGETSFDFQALTTLTNLKLLGDAHIYNNTTIRLTDVPNSGAGRVLYYKPITFRLPGNPNPTSFTTHFAFSIVTLNRNSIGGGLAFEISPENESIGASGGFLGIPAISVAVEFDTVKDEEFKDVNGNHVGIDINSVVSLQVANLDSVNISLKSGELIHSWVDYSGPNRQLKVFISYVKTKPVSPVLSVTLDLYLYVNEFMFVGFSGSTQGSTEVHSVEFWTFSSFFDGPNRKSVGLNSPPSPPPPIDTMPTTLDTKTTRKYPKWLIGPLVVIIASLFGGGIYLKIKYQNGSENQYYNKFYNICNCCSDVNNIAV